MLLHDKIKRQKVRKDNKVTNSVRFNGTVIIIRAMRRGLTLFDFITAAINNRLTLFYNEVTFSALHISDG